jgi:hypothetical protein
VVSTQSTTRYQNGVFFFFFFFYHVQSLIVGKVDVHGTQYDVVTIKLTRVLTS